MKNFYPFFKYLTIIISCFFAFEGFSTPETDLNDAIVSANTNASQNNTITFPSNITNVTITLRPLNSLDTFAFVNKNLTIDGNNKKLTTTIGGIIGSGGSYRRGFFVGGSETVGPPIRKVTIQNLTIDGAIALGGNSEFGGAGAGLGGALFVGKDTNVVIKNVKFKDCAAIGGKCVDDASDAIQRFSGGGLGGDSGISDNSTAGGAGGFIFDGGTASIVSPAGGGGGSAAFVGGNANVITNNGGKGGNNFAGADGGAGGILDGDGSDGSNGGGGGGGGASTSPKNGGKGSYGAGGGASNVLTGSVGGTSDFGGGGGYGSSTGGDGGFGGGGGWGREVKGGAGGFGGGGGSGTAAGIKGFGGGDGTTGASLGGGGAAMGGAIFIQDEGQLTVEEFVSFTVSSLIKGTGTNDGEALGKDIFMMSGGQIIFDLSIDSKIENAIEGNLGDGGGSVFDGGLTKKGTATLTLMDKSFPIVKPFTYTGTTKVEDGTLVVNGTIITPVVVTGGTFKGNATLVDANLGLPPDLTNTGGTIAPGASIGTIIVPGNFSHTAGVLEIEIDQNITTSSDLVAVGGNVTFGGALHIVPLSQTEFFQEGAEFTIVTYGGSRNGVLFPVTDPHPLLEFDVDYRDALKQVVIILKKSLLLLPIPFNNANAENVAEYLLNCDLTNTDFNDILANLTSLDLTNLTDALLQLSPARFGALQYTNFSNGRVVSQILTDHLRKLYRCQGCADECYMEHFRPSCWSVWVEPFAYFTHQSVSESLSLRPFSSNVYGGVVGADYSFPNNITFGSALAYSYSDIDWQGNLGDADIHSVYGGLYSSWFNYRGFGNLSLIGTWNHYDVDRRVLFADIDRVAKHDHDGWDVTAHGGCGLEFLMKNNFYFQPTVDVDYTYNYQESFKEKGADSINLFVDSYDFSYIRAQGLLNFIKDIKYCDWCISPAIRVGYAYEDGLGSSNIKSKMESPSCCLADKFSIKTYTKGHSKGIAGFNLTSSSQNGFTSYLNYQFEFGDSFHQNLVSVRAEWNW